MMKNLDIYNNRLFYNDKPFCFYEDKDSIIKKIGKDIINDDLLKGIHFDYYSFDCLFEYTDNCLSNLTLIPSNLNKGINMEEIRKLIERTLIKKGVDMGNSLYLLQDIAVKLESNEYDFTLKIYG